MLFIQSEFAGTLVDILGVTIVITLLVFGFVASRRDHANRHRPY